ncbi:MAG: glycosyltransferase family 39 protein [Candidatus Accumulibacter sp.]|nr:glycosyltransferase family 39 protein [Accumulibacter sp.]
MSDALKRFNWPWYPLLIGSISRLSGFSSEMIARLSCEFMTAIACLLSVDIVRKKRPDLSAWAVLVVLSIPAFNEYRGEILRENGFWCFSMLALWSMYSFENAHRVFRLLFACVSIAIAAAFRLEAVYIFIVLVIVEFSRIQGRALKITAISGTLVLMAIILFWSLRHDLLPAGRVTSFVSRIDPKKMFVDFLDFARYAALRLPKFSFKDAELILFIGFCGYLVGKIISALGIFSLPWVLSWRSPKKIQALAGDPLSIAAIGYVGILLIFLIDSLFVSGRYVSFLGFLLLPWLSAGVQHVARRWPKTFLPIIALSIVLAIANSISLSGQKTFTRDIGRWISDNLSKEDRIYFEDTRMRYYAQRDPLYKKEVQSRAVALAIEGDEAYEYFALDLGCQPDAWIRLLRAEGLRPVVSFSNDRGCAAAVFRRAGTL